jgi:hypothetical protein
MCVVYSSGLNIEAVKESEPVEQKQAATPIAKFLDENTESKS